MSELSQRIANLSLEKRQLLLQKLNEKKENLFSRTTIEPHSRKSNSFPLSFAQQRLWLLDQLEPDSIAYNIPQAMRLKGQINVSAWERSINEIVRRHEALRTTFTTVEGQPLQVIAPTLTLTIPVVDMQELPPTKLEGKVQQLATEEAQGPFDLSKDPLLRMMLLQLGKSEYVMLLTIHHIVSDGWSFSVLIRELVALYKAFNSARPLLLPKLPIQYADFALWQRQWFLGEQRETQIAYWKQQLANAPSVIELPTDRPRQVVQTYRGAKQSLQLSKTLTEALKALSQQEGVTLFMMLLAAFNTLLYRYTQQEDILVGTTISGRNRVETEGLIGFFVNTLVLRTHLGGNPSFRELLGRVRQVASEAYAHQDMPFEQIVEELKIERHLSHTPLFQVMFQLQNFPRATLDLPGLTVSHLEFDKGTVRFELAVEMTETEQGLSGIMEYNVALFDEATITQMLGCFQTLLQGIVADPNQRLSDLPLLKVAQQQLLVEWNDTSVEYSQHQCIHQIFEAQVERTPDAVAVVFELEQLTYCELNARANQLADYLRSLAVESEVLVGICVERSLSMVIGLLGILKAGGAYVPLDPAYPQERLAFILQDAAVSVLLTQQRLIENFPKNQTRVVCLDTDWGSIGQQSQQNPINNCTTDNLAYIIYTSGSTGQPKGVLVNHANVVRLLSATQSWYHFNQQDVWTLFHSYAFDFSVWELWGALLYGGQLVVVPYWLSRSPENFYKLLLTQQVTVLNQTPSAFRQLIQAEESLGDANKLSLRLVIFGGEVLELQSLRPWFKRHGDQFPQLVNMYGITETTVHVTYRPLKMVDLEVVSESVIGRPIPDLQVYLLDRYQQLVPIGVRGEMYVGGAGLARGYLNRPELTALKFIPNSLSNQLNARLYKSGDLARYLANGDIEYLGRIDHQVKIRGFRIELGEIEAVIHQHPAVRETIVVVREDSADSQRLVAYVVLHTEQTLTIPELRRFLELKLPNYMMPTAFVMLEALPLTPNGKVDRNALHAPEVTQLLSESDFIAPSTPIEEMLALIWVEVLGIEKIGIHNNFFTLGGHSLLATRVISKVGQVFQQELPLRRLFEQPTIAGLALDIEKATKAGLGLETVNIKRISRSQELPLSFAQQRLWFLAQLEPNSPFYNIPTAVCLQGQLNLGALQQSFNEILRRHEALRTNFQTIEGQPVAVILETKPLLLPVFDISELPLNQQQVEVRQLAHTEAQQPFDLNSDFLLRVKLLCLSEQKYIVLLTMHHIASDGWSIGVLVRELATLYQNFCDHQPSRRHAALTLLPELPIQYVDFAAWQRQWLQGEVLESQISYWKKQLEGAPAVLELPTDHPRPAVQTFWGATYSFELSLELSQALKKLSQQRGCTLFMTLLSAFNILLGRYTGQEDIVVGSPIANRNRADIEGLIGLFVNTLVLRTNLADNPTFEELLTRVREVALGAYAHQDLPIEQLVEELQPQRDLSHTPLFQVMFVLQNTPMFVLELPNLSLSLLASESFTAKFDLTLSMVETAQGLVGTLEYNTDLFESNTISRMAGHLQTLLRSIVANPQQRVLELPLLTQAEKALLVQWSDTQVEYPKHQCVHHLFEAQVECTPDAVAIVFELEQLTYRELNARANQLAHYLRSLGVGPEVLVGISTRRSLSMVIGLLGILKAGGAYVPLDPTYPQERLNFILENAQVTVLLTQARLVEVMPQYKAKVICLDTDWQVIAQENKENSVIEVTTNNLAYVIYTSGTQGKPKGVQIPHRALSNFLHAMRQTLGLTEQDTLLAVTTISFDIAALELFLPIIVGARLIVVSREIASDGTCLKALLTHSKVTVMQATPATWQLLLVASWQGNHQLKILCGGEVLPRHIANQLLSRCSSLWNMYGPTETTIWSAACLVKTNSSVVSINHPIANTQFYILDQQAQLVPVGVPGELHIGGDGLARGYLNDSGLTAEKFIPNPFSNKSAARLYKTGDLVRYLDNGEIEYIGRIDHQTKIRGFRIELGEIETCLTQHPTVREAVVIVREDVAGYKRLVAYVVSEQELTHTSNELRNFLKEKLPDYMIPAIYVPIKALPLTPNNKVDRQALPAPDSLRPRLEVTYIKPQTDLEKSITTVWQKALKLEKVGIEDNFFDLGGHSLLMVQVHSHLCQIFQDNFSILELLKYPTIKSLAEFLSQANRKEPSSLNQNNTIDKKLKDSKNRIKNFLKTSKRVR